MVFWQHLYLGIPKFQPTVTYGDHFVRIIDNIQACHDHGKNSLFLAIHLILKQPSLINNTLKLRDMYILKHSLQFVLFLKPRFTSQDMRVALK